MLHYQCCLTCLPHTRLSCFAFFFFFFFRSQISKVLFQTLVDVRKQWLITFNNNYCRFSPTCIFGATAHYKNNCFPNVYNTMIPTQVFQLNYCRKIVRFVWKPVYQTEKSTSSSRHELNCFLSSCHAWLVTVVFFHHGPMLLRSLKDRAEMRQGSINDV